MTDILDVSAIPMLTTLSQGLKALDRYGLLHSFDGPEYDELIELATDLTETPYGMITLVLPDEGTVKTRVGGQIASVSETDSFTTVTIRDRFVPTVVGDATRDPRFAANPFVTGEVGLRAYIGVTISSIHDEPLAVLEVVDTWPRVWTPRQVRHMTVLGHMVEAHLELRRVLHEAVLTAS